MSGLQFHAEGARGIVLMRHFDAPPGAVFAAMVTPAQVARWLGPGGWSLDEMRLDPHPGGLIRMAWTGPDGVAAIRGTVLDLSPPHVIRLAACGLPCCDDGSLEAETRIDPEAAGTRATIRLRLDGAPARDALLDGPMPERMEALFLVLDEVLRS